MKPVILFKDEEYYSSKRPAYFGVYRRRIMAGFMILSDFLCLVTSLTLAIFLWRMVRTDFLLDVYQSLILPATGLFMAIYLLSGLYPGIGLGPVEELRHLTISSSLGMLGLIGLSFYSGSPVSWSRAILGLAWVFILFSTPIARKIFRRLASRLKLWGTPVVVIGETDEARSIYTKLRKNPLAGLWPVLCVKVSSLDDVFDHPLEQTKKYPWAGKTLFKDIDIAIITPQKSPLGAVKHVLLDKNHSFKRIIVMFDEQHVGSVWFTPVHLVEYLGLEVTHNLINPTQQVIKRIIDLGLILISLPFLIILFLLLAIAIKLDSPGPVFYTQRRVGYNGKELMVWKFRTMVVNAEQVLNEHLEKHPALRAEWLERFKLKEDPRITRLGNILRRSSLDELPQLWNVLRNEMSLIGPRPIVEEEIALYGEEFEIYKQVLPGMTGMWQISGRNDLTYQERVNLDVYYIQNWSIWLDAHILMHTTLVPFQGRGAY